MIKNVLNISGGKDSTAMYLLALEQEIDFVAVFADTGNEHPITYEYVSDLPRKTGGPDIKWVHADFADRIQKRRIFVANDQRKRSVRYPNKAKRRILQNLEPTGNPFLDLCMWKGRFPSTRRRFCSDELKHKPVFQQVQFPLLEHGHLVISWQGVRAQESPSRAELPRREIDPNDNRLINFRPILDWSHDDVFAMHKRHGIEPNPLYKMGFGRVGCMPCIHSRKAEIKNISDRFPDQIQKISRWECKTGLVSKMGLSTFFPYDKTPKSHKPDIWDVIDWSKTAHGGTQYALPFPVNVNQCTSMYGLCE